MSNFVWDVNIEKLNGQDQILEEQGNLIILQKYYKIMLKYNHYIIMNYNNMLILQLEKPHLIGIFSY